jgi:hypothetical protein
MGRGVAFLVKHSFPRMVGGLRLAFDSFGIAHVLSRVSSTPDVFDTHPFRQIFPVIPSECPWAVPRCEQSGRIDCALGGSSARDASR